LVAEVLARPARSVDLRNCSYSSATRHQEPSGTDRSRLSALVAEQLQRTDRFDALSRLMAKLVERTQRLDALLAELDRTDQLDAVITVLGRLSCRRLLYAARANAGLATFVATSAKAT